MRFLVAVRFPPQDTHWSQKTGDEAAISCERD
jgi:hypothetical protein